MSLHAEILDAATKIIGDTGDVYIDREYARATDLIAISRQTGYSEMKTVVHGMGYLTETRIWAESFLGRITI